VTKVVNDIITNNTDVETTVDSAKVAIGSVVIGMMAADAAKDYVHPKIDAVAEFFTSRKEAQSTQS
jgi:hypothetical protein